MMGRWLLPRELSAAAVAAALLPVALAAALIEACALRLVLRMGQALPARPGLGEFFGVVADVGVLAQNLATVAGTVTLAALALDRAASHTTGARLSGVLLLVSAATVTLLAAGAGGPVLWLVASALSLAAMTAAVITAPTSPLHGGRAWLALPLATYALLLYHVSAQAAASLGAGLPGAAEAYFAAEGIAVVAALALPFAVRPRFTVPRLLAAAALPLVVLLALQVRPWIVASLSVWTFGFTLFLPTPLYPLALAAFLFSLLALAQDGQDSRLLAVGLAFMALGGLKLDYSYFHLLALLAVAYLTCGQRAAVDARAAALLDATLTPAALRKAV